MLEIQRAKMGKQELCLLLEILRLLLFRLNIAFLGRWTVVFARQVW
jgi:hypothetical protein